MDRRSFLIGCGAGASMIAMSRWRLFANPLEKLSLMNAGDPNHTFVLLFLRGGCDGLQLLAPISDQYYNDSRPRGLKTVDRDGLVVNGESNHTGFAFHPKAEELHRLYQDGELAVIHACGLINGTRSHFDAMDLIERGVNEKNAIRDGWMGRYLKQYGGDGVIPGVSAGENLAETFSGFGKASSIQNLKEYDLLEGLRDHELVRKLYKDDPLMESAANQTLNTIQFIQSNLSETARKELERGANGYPKEWYAQELSQSLKTVAQLIKMNAGARMINVDYGGWDTHERQEQVFPNLVAGLSKSVDAFYKDIGEHRNNVTILIMSEFGRRLRANRSGGTDHGHGNVMFALGGKVNGGKMYGSWPGLHPDVLDRGVDLSVTSDYRNVISNILMKGMKIEDYGNIFPGFDQYKNLGFI